MDDPRSGPGDSSHDARSFGSFRVRELLAASADTRVYRARDEQVDRPVMLRVAGDASAEFLLADARRLAAVSHPGLVVVLGASRSEEGAYAAVQDANAVPISEAGALSAEEAARVAADVAGAIEALSQSSLRATVDDTTVLVARTAEGIRGLLDPLRAHSPGRSCLAPADRAASTQELADLLELIPQAPSSAAPTTRPRGGRRLIGALCLAVVVAGGIAVLAHERSAGARKQGAAPVRQGHAARIVARIPLGMTGDEGAAAFAFADRTVWVATSTGRLLRVDPAANQVVGSPIVLGDEHPLADMRASGGKLYTVDYDGWLLRIDPGTRRVSGRRHFGAPLTAVSAAAGVLWISSSGKGGAGQLLRVDATTLRDAAAPLDGLPEQLHRAEVSGSRAWVLGGSETGIVARVDTASGERKLAYVGPLPTTIRLDGGTLWVTDRFNGTVSALDAERMAFVGEPLRVPRSAFDVVPAGRDLWVTAASETSVMRVERFDARTGRRAGGAVAIGKDNGRLAFGLGSLWAATGTDLVRLSPTMPRPALALAAPAPGSPRTSRPGPLPAGTWRTDGFLAPFTFSTPAFAWLGVFPGPDVVALMQTRSRRAELDVVAPLQVFAADTSLRKMPGPAGLLRLLRANRFLRVGAVHRVTVGGRPALQFVVRHHDPVRHPDICGPRPCTLLFPSRESTTVLLGDDVLRLSLLTSAGRTLVVVEGYDEPALGETAPLLRTFRFAA